jgi:NAD(P)-dependent dehydrogenase (short-subunit alcohol dehydrogenase family)
MVMKTVVITGATAGIGRATALHFAKAGYRVAAYGRNQEALDSLREHLGAEGIAEQLDVRDAGAWRTRLAELAEVTGGTLDVLVNNAGVLSSGPFAEVPLEEQQTIMAINVGGMLNGCHIAYPYLKATPGAKVINLSSASAIYGQPELATYSASKFAIRGLTEALELEWAADDIQVSAVWPLFVDTGMVVGVDTASTRNLGVSLTADDVAASIVSLASSNSWLPHSVHHAVGRQAKGLMALSSVAPSWFMREVNKRVTHS